MSHYRRLSTSLVASLSSSCNLYKYGKVVLMDLSLKSTRGFLLIDEFGGTIRLLQVEEVVLDVSSTGR